jgi:hypothetical protein
LARRYAEIASRSSAAREATAVSPPKGSHRARYTIWSRNLASIELSEALVYRREFFGARIMDSRTITLDAGAHLGQDILGIGRPVPCAVEEVFELRRQG